MTATGEIFTASDLDRRRRAVLDRARQGTALIRDTDGLALVMLPEHRLEVYKQAAIWATVLRVVEPLLGTENPIPIERFGLDTWLRHLGPDELVAFVSEMWAAIGISAGDPDADDLAQAVTRWRERAAVIDRQARFDSLVRYGVDRSAETGREAGEAAAIVRRRRTSAGS